MSDKLWQCPNCGRKFANKNQWHSCVTIQIEEHFKNKPKEVKQAFDKLVEEVRKFGPVKIDPVKTAINLGRTSHFSMVYPMQSGLKLDFSLYRKLKSSRAEQTAVVGPGRYLYLVKLNSKKDVDNELIGWLKEAYKQS